MPIPIRCRGRRHCLARYSSNVRNWSTSFRNRRLSSPSNSAQYSSRAEITAMCGHRRRDNERLLTSHVFSSVLPDARTVKATAILTRELRSRNYFNAQVTGQKRNLVNRRPASFVPSFFIFFFLSRSGKRGFPMVKCQTITRTRRYLIDQRSNSSRLRSALSIYLLFQAGNRQKTAYLVDSLY